MATRLMRHLRWKWRPAASSSLFALTRPSAVSASFLCFVCVMCHDLYYKQKFGKCGDKPKNLPTHQITFLRMISPKHLIAPLIVVVSLFATSCIGGESKPASTEVEVRRAELASQGNALRTVTRPSEIYPITFTDRDSLLGFVSDAYDSFSRINFVEFETPPDERLPVLTDEDIEVGMHEACDDVSLRDIEGLNAFVNRLETTDRTHGQKEKLKFFLWAVLTTQYDHNHDMEPEPASDGGTPLPAEPDYRTFCST